MLSKIGGKYPLQITNILYSRFQISSPESSRLKIFSPVSSRNVNDGELCKNS